jgi:hypothetical protein
MGSSSSEVGRGRKDISWEWMGRSPPFGTLWKRLLYPYHFTEELGSPDVKVFPSVVARFNVHSFHNGHEAIVAMSPVRDALVLYREYALMLSCSTRVAN